MHGCCATMEYALVAVALLLFSEMLLLMGPGIVCPAPLG